LLVLAVCARCWLDDRSRRRLVAYHTAHERLVARVMANVSRR
jgi:hypothetical protein